MEYKFKFGLWQMVRLVHDKDQTARMVTQAKICGAGIMYNLSVGNSNSWHYEAEIQSDGVTQRVVGFKVKTP